MKDVELSVAGTAALIGLWHFLSLRVSPLVMASPVDAIGAAWKMLIDGQFFFQHTAATLWRVLLSLALGSLSGFFLGLAAGFFPAVLAFLEPLRRVITGIPGIVAAVLAMIWFGLGSAMAVFLGAVFIIPVVYLNVAEGIRQCDRTYLEMAAVYQLPATLRLRAIYMPMLGGALASSLVLVTGNSLRLVIMAEVLGADNGLGFVLGISRARLNMPDLYGCVLLCLLFVWGVELTIRKVLFRWLHG